MTQENSITNPRPFDIRVENHGTVATITAQTDAGREWIDRDVFCEDWQASADTIAAEPRMALAIIEGAHADGLRV